MKIPTPPKWSKVVDGLDMADFLAQAREFERSRLPRDMIFPREDQIWEAVQECEIGFLAFFTRVAFAEIHKAMEAPTQPPFFPCASARLNTGEKVRILAVDGPRPLGVSFVPLRYAELETNLVPEHIRTRPGYTHYHLTAPTARTFGLEKPSDYFGECFHLVEDAARTP